jgi:hypothetical protein
MAEPTSGAAAGYLGVKFASLLAGFAGGVVSLSYLRQLTPLQMALAVLAGTFMAGYLTPLAQHWIGMPDEVENGVAFLLGMTAMNLVPGFLRLSERFLEDPEAMLKRDKK